MEVSSSNNGIKVTAKEELVKGRFLNMYNIKYTAEFDPTEERETVLLERPFKPEQ